MAGAARALQAVAQQAQHLAVGAAALAGVLVQQHLVEGSAQDLGLGADVLVAAVAGAADHHRAAAGRHGFGGGHQGGDGVGVVAVVGDHGGAAVVEHVEAAGHAVHVADEAGQPALDGVPGHAHGPGGTHGGHHVLDLEADLPAARERHLRQRQALLEAGLGADDVTALHEHHAFALRAVGGDHRVLAVLREEGHAAGAVRRHGGHGRVGGVQHGGAGGRHVEHDHALEHAQVFQRGDVVQAQVVAAAHVGDDGHLALVEGQAFAQQAATRGFQHRGVDVGVHQHVARAARAGAVAGIGLAAVHVHAVGVGHAHAQALGLEQVGGQAHGGGLAVGAGDGDHRDAAVAAARVHVVDHRLAHVAPLAERGADVHAQAGRGVDFDDAAALLFQRADDGFTDHVDTADVQAHGLGCFDGAGGHVGVHAVGHVSGGAAGGQVGVVAQHHALALGGHGIRGEVLGGQARLGDGVDADLGERGAVALATARVQVDLGHQFAHGVLAVADHQRRVAPGSGDQLVAHHQQAEVVAGQVFLDHHAAVLGRGVVGDVEMAALGDAHRHALALVAVLRLDHHRQADILGGGPAVVLAVDRAAARHRHAGRMQQLLGQVLVLGDGFGDGAGAVHLGGLDAPLQAAPAELHQAALREAADRDAARQRRFHDGTGGGAKAHVFVQLGQRGHGGGHVVRGTVSGSPAQALGMFEGLAADVFLGVLHGHLVDARLLGRRGAAEGDRAAGLGLQRQRHQLQCVGHGDRHTRLVGMQPAHGGEQLAQAFFEGGGGAQVALGLGAAHHGLDGGMAAPQVGAAQRANAGNFHDGSS